MNLLEHLIFCHEIFKSNYLLDRHVEVAPLLECVFDKLSLMKVTFFCDFCSVATLASIPKHISP
jgi:hypothetical protein